MLIHSQSIRQIISGIIKTVSKCSTKHWSWTPASAVCCKFFSIVALCFSSIVFTDSLYDNMEMYELFMIAGFWVQLLQYCSLLRLIVLLWKFPELRQTFRTYLCCCHCGKKTQTEVVEEDNADFSKNNYVVYWNVKKGVKC